MSELFVYGPQADAARTPLEGAGLRPTRMHRVTERYQLRGTERGMFVIVRGHGQRIPDDIAEELRIVGMVTLEISDEFARARVKAARQTFLG